MLRFAIISCLLAIPASVLVGSDEYFDPEILPEERAHWSLQSPKRPPAPKVANPRWIKNPIDSFILAKLEAAGLRPSPEADRLTLIRRVTLDLTGLPPASAEVEAFLKDKRPDAYERLVDRLIDSPQFGERQAQHWLDVVRFAETNGYEADKLRPHAWRYRDYVIRSLNADKPYDRFLTEQIAGDELAAGKPPREVADLWAATGLHRCGPVHRVSGNLEDDVIRQEVMTEMVSGFGSAVLGLTIGCARCHDHKFDPISQGDFYRLQAFFGSTKYVEIDLATSEEKAARKKVVDAIAARTRPLKQAVSAIDAPVRARLQQAKRDALEAKYQNALAVPSAKRTAQQRKLAADAQPLLTVRWDEVVGGMGYFQRLTRSILRERIHELERHLPPPTAAAWAIQNGTPRETFVFKRGNPKAKLSAVVAAFPRVLDALESRPKTRLELATWITRPEHPLTARVIVNRLWQHHFGKGIVGTPNDFGIRGERPTHPKLLDWLVTELVHPTWGHPASRKAWTLKRIHKLMVLSATYRQSSVPDPARKVPKSQNKLLWHMNRQRLEAEALRDSILMAAGTLNKKQGGTSVRVPLEPEVYSLIFTEGEPDGLWPVTPDPREHTRRSIYLLNKRNLRLPLLEAFDQPDTLNSCAVRPVSTFAPQALILMNGPFVQQQGKELAIRLANGEAADSSKQIAELYRRTLGRLPSEMEKALALAFLKDQAATIREQVKGGRPLGLPEKRLPKGADPAAIRALADLCIVLFNGNEFAHRP